MNSILLTLALATAAAVSTPAQAPDPRDQFFEALGALCGARFEGAMTFRSTPRTISPASGWSRRWRRAPRRKSACPSWSARTIRAPGSSVAAADGLQLKHDHRHADGTPDAVTLYGGLATDAGSALVQSFPADAYTARLIPAAASNVWTLSLGADGTSLGYHLDRDGKPRFTAVLTRGDRAQ